MESHVFERFEKGSAGSGGGQVSVTAVDGGAGTDDPFHTMSGGIGPLETDVSVSDTDSWIDQQLAETPFTRDDLELFVRAAGAAATIAALYVAYRGGR